MSAADDAREWLNVAPSFTEGRRHVVALLAQFDQAQVVAKWLIAETEYKSDAYSVRQEAKTLRQRDEARDDIKRARAALDELVSHGDLTPSGRRVLRSILGGDS
ncbi:hypothetical protein SEA_KENNA_61 [Gordonia phage Kenna]|uniref:Uncharacterized protein n=2 Tax=Getalongvirus kenna TaxID=2734201 RepID=A0A3S9UPX3_9CAUD|nr:hypothetical protein HOU97_gp61 [Gordonia phage Kenna]AZS12337.1 hypothetical protein SEA_KENNA_61 [Gordonia phage Kenna]QCG77223.1 hypothetical protein SEA_LUTUM_66 [Gordonia phage Lutum]